MKLNTLAATSVLNVAPPPGARPKSTESDMALALRMAIGDTHATGLLFTRYGGLLFGLASCMLGDEAAAECAVISAFEAACIDARSLERRAGTVKDFLVQHVRTRSIELIRTRRAIARTSRTVRDTHSEGDHRDVQK